jgi:hypothetical protein
MAIPRKDLPRFVMKCWNLAKKANEQNRVAEIERQRFYVGGDLQWREEEITKRKDQQRPWITINKVKPAVDQIEGDIRLNPPGPQVHPVTETGADSDTADIMAGLIREVEYRSAAKTAYSLAGRDSACSGFGCLELATEWAGERSFSQRLVILPVEDPCTVFFDPTSRKANRQDAMWAGKLKMYSKEEYESEFGKRKVTQAGGWHAIGWMQEAIGINGNLAMVNEWTGAGLGPYFVCEFYMVELERRILRMYTDLIARYDDETVPKGVKPKEGAEYTREVPKRTVKKYLVDALEVLDETEWPGNLIPLFPVLGPEVYIKGKLHRLSLIAGAIDAQRGFNFAATAATEMASYSSKAPWIGPRGTFDDPRWKTANTEWWSFLEYTPVWVVNEGNPSESVLAPPPTKNTWETAIEWALQLAAFFSDSIKSVTAIYDPSLGQVKGDQSGKAIEQLRSESSVGNFSYADNLHRAIEVIYQEMCCIFPKIMDSATVATIIRADGEPEKKLINQDFSATQGIDPKTGKKGQSNNICLGEYSARVTVDKSYLDRQDEALSLMVEFMKLAPQAMATPGVAAQVLRLIGQGNPKVDAIADMLAPPQPGEEMTPQQLQAQLQQEQVKSQQLQQVAQQLHMAVQAKLPQVEADKFKALLDNLTKIRVAEITASKDRDKAAADREADTLEHLTGMAHETAMQAAEHEHEEGMADKQAQAASEQQDQAHQQTLEQQQQAAEQEPVEAKQ